MRNFLYSNMAQVAIREYDAKKMWSEYSLVPYSGLLIEQSEDMERFLSSSNTQSFVIKPDQLFGKRGKYGLVGVKLDPLQVQTWWNEKNNSEVEIK